MTISAARAWRCTPRPSVRLSLVCRLRRPPSKLRRLVAAPSLPKNQTKTQTQKKKQKSPLHFLSVCLYVLKAKKPTNIMSINNHYHRKRMCTTPCPYYTSSIIYIVNNKCCEITPPTTTTNSEKEKKKTNGKCHSRLHQVY